LQRTITNSEIKIFDNIPTSLTVKVIPAYLDSILLNILTNAIRYRCTKPATLEITFEKTDEHTVIYFKDNGLGINMERNQHKIFGMYKTFHGNKDAKGIGLFMIKNQIEAMKGKIELKVKKV
jgi:K+-sensing histidine kinase KdpD